MNWKWITDLNVEAKTIKLLQQNRKGFLGKAQKAQFIKEIDKNIYHQN